MVNEAWLDAFTNSKAHFLPPGCSDHCAGCVEISLPFVSTTRKPFKFFNFWAKHEEFLALVKQTWDSTQVTGCYMFQLCKKLKALKPVLKKLNKKSYGDI
ncbi:hypothetical protein SLE2022_327580 [Rubroshorea leprosula]